MYGWHAKVLLIYVDRQFANEKFSDSWRLWQIQRIYYLKHEKTGKRSEQKRECCDNFCTGAFEPIKPFQMWIKFEQRIHHERNKDNHMLCFSGIPLNLFRTGWLIIQKIILCKVLKIVNECADDVTSDQWFTLLSKIGDLRDRSAIYSVNIVLNVGIQMRSKFS